MARQFIISIMTRDRIGIVADVANALKELGGNLADLSQTVLAGHFTMILVVAFPAQIDQQTVRDRLLGIDAEEPFEVGIKIATADHPATSSTGEEQYVVTAVGQDQIGLVAAISSYLRQAGVNIVDFTTQVEAGRYTMILAINLPDGIRIAEFKAQLQQAMAKVGVSVELQHRRIFIATNEV